MIDLSQSRIRQVAIVCKDVARATAFYRDTLGLPFLFAAGPNLAFFDCGGVRLMLSTDEREQDRHASSMLYYLVTNIEETHRTLAEKGVVFGGLPHMIAQMPDHQLWLADFTDSEGNGLVLMEEKR
jgi:methylmalonyl-CoA/ethylmalonyl-CoA epimerase